VRGHRSAMSLPVEFDPFDMRIDVERGRAQESDQRLATFTRKIHRERRGSGNRGDDGDAGGERFLHDLERGTAADQEEVMTEREKPVEKGASNRLIDSVMASDIFADDERIAKKIKNSRGMDASGASEVV